MSRLYGLSVNRRDIREKVFTTLAGTFLGAAVLVGPALLTNYVKFEPKLPGITVIWIFHNLAFVCVIEELLFRNYIFEGINRVFKKRKSSNLYPTVISAIFFGLYHFRGGPILMALATIAGLIYALAYKRGGLVSAIFSHFGVNFIHFLLFSYPALQRGLH